MRALHLAAAFAYAAAAALYLANVHRRRPAVVRAARIVLAVAAALHVAAIGSRCTGGYHPLRDLSGVLSLSGLSVAILFVVATFKWRLEATGALSATLALLLLLGSWLAMGASPVPAGSAPILARLHLVLVALGLAIYAVAAIVAVLYLAQESALKRHRLGALYRRTPPITTLDEINRRLVLAGFPVFTLALVTGLLWLARLPEKALRPEYLLAALVWALFAVLLAARHAVGLRGRSAALMTVAGAVVLLLVLLLYAARAAAGAP